MNYKLYHCNRGYLCQVSAAEIAFLFDIHATDINEINFLLATQNDGYYIK